MRELVVLLSDVEKLKKKLEGLNEQYLELYEKMEDLKKEQEYFNSIYMSMFGALIFLRFKKQIEYRKLKKKLILIIKSKNIGENIDLQEIEKKLELELAEFYKNLEELRRDLKSSQEFLESPILSDKELKEIKSVFRKLAKILHPDINKNLSENMLAIWFKVKEAYENNDLITLIILEGLVNNDIKENIKINSIDERIDILSKKIVEIKESIHKEENSFPLNIKELLRDDEYISDKKEEITSAIRKYDKHILEFNKRISQLLEEDSYE